MPRSSVQPWSLVRNIRLLVPRPWHLSRRESRTAQESHARRRGALASCGEVKVHALCILEEPSIATFVHSVGKSNTDRDETYDFLLQSSGSGWSVATCRKTRHNTFGGPGRTTALDATARLESPNGETVTEYRVLITALLCSRPPSLARSLVLSYSKCHARWKSHIFP